MRFARRADSTLDYPPRVKAAFLELTAVGEPEIEMPLLLECFSEQRSGIMGSFPEFAVHVYSDFIAARADGRPYRGPHVGGIRAEFLPHPLRRAFRDGLHRAAPACMRDSDRGANGIVKIGTPGKSVINASVAGMASLCALAPLPRSASVTRQTLSPCTCFAAVNDSRSRFAAQWRSASKTALRLRGTQSQLWLASGPSPNFL